MEFNEDIQVILTARTAAYKLFWGLFADEPTTDRINAFKEDIAVQSIDLFDLEETDTYATAITDFTNAINAVQTDADIDALKGEYTKLFIGPNKLVSPPWESVYVTKERLLFQESTLEVRRAYVAEGVIPAEYPHVADDHISLELNFLSVLANNALEAYVELREEDYLHNINATIDFIEKHLGKWLPEYTESIVGDVPNSLYAIGARVINELVKVDLKLCKEMAE